SAPRREGPKTRGNGRGRTSSPVVQGRSSGSTSDSPSRDYVMGPMNVAARTCGSLEEWVRPSSTKIPAALGNPRRYGRNNIRPTDPAATGRGRSACRVWILVQLGGEILCNARVRF